MVRVLWEQSLMLSNGACNTVPLTTDHVQGSVVKMHNLLNRLNSMSKHTVAMDTYSLYY